METKAQEKFSFQAEINQLLDILVHSLYSSREIFLRELISNASDALDKLRILSLRGEEYAQKDLPLEIKISFDKDAKMLVITDTGIGMTKEELIKNIGTIAKSGSSEFIKAIKAGDADAKEIIGRFGVGFYSVFMVAEEVKIKTRSYIPSEQGYIWKSTGKGDFTITEVVDEVNRGTSIEIYLKEDADEYADKQKLEGIIKKHSGFISYPIYLAAEKVNTITALWKEPKSNIKPEQYNEFYKFVSHGFTDPECHIHLSVDAPIQFNALLFIPKQNYDFFGMNRDNYGLDLYVRKVLIQHQSKDLLPEFLSFVKGVVDSEDLPLNVSRETLQENAIFGKIAKEVTKAVLKDLNNRAKNDPEQYKRIYEQHGKYIKLGFNDQNNREQYLELLRFESLNNEAGKMISLTDYKESLKAEQKEFYYALGNSRESLAADPAVEIFKKKGLDVLFLYDPVDEYALSMIGKYGDYDLVSVEKADISKLDSFVDVKNKESELPKLNKSDEKLLTELAGKMKEILGDKVKEVKISNRLSEHAVWLTTENEMYSSSFRRMMKGAGPMFEGFGGEKALEINKNNPVIRNLLIIYRGDKNSPVIPRVVNLLYLSAELGSGDLKDPFVLVKELNSVLDTFTRSYTIIK
ncbi:MAG: molecular chaperone HtpG [Ignavibacteriales bacterium]|nr:MAG: molecular chaperone HtpG [Ignavibacteriaceae bacterium]MBW7874239.1 molecular chaperone HtpG [Ignavibacteria bacterium]MCZ2142289.1 molecular chaperone HtpG [Ignavibacteriales bacterium]MBV6445173.1 Chaperone protein HtpG [Ignavibacteriaceae bacterium]MBZ0195829.1 molecular chaperone HtpG [Ignavibacteriaceae bacterium]